MPKEGEGPDIKGSVMLALAESKEEVLEALKADVSGVQRWWRWSADECVQVYSESEVWDWDKVG